MTRKTIAFLSMDNLEQFVCYDYLVKGLLETRGHKVDEISWRSKVVNWNDYDLVVIRSPWDYQQNAGEFLAVLETIEASTAQLCNSLEVVKWNLQKTYLRDIADRGAAIVPTEWIQSPSVADLKNLFGRLGSQQIVVKPVVGANADNAFWLRTDSSESQFQDVVRTFVDQLALAQPFVESVCTFGEVSLIFFESEFSHAILKTPRAGDFRVQEEHGGVIQPWTADAKLIEFARQCLAASPDRTLYSRADIVFLENQQPAIMELELIEPSLYLTFSETAAETFANAIERCLS